MAKVPFTKLQASVDGCETGNSYENKNGESITYYVKHYLPVKDKLEMISNIINQSLDGNGFYNPLRVKMFTALEIVYAYTNLSFTDKMKDDPFKLYDILVSTGIYTDIVQEINPDDIECIMTTVTDTIDNIYKYKNSVMGILDAVNNDYEGMNLDAEAIRDKIADPNNLELLKTIIAKLG